MCIRDRSMAGIRYRVSGREHIPMGAVVFCSNHESNVDPPVLFEALHPQLHILYKAELHKFPIMGTAFDVGGFVAVERDNRERAMASIGLSLIHIFEPTSLLSISYAVFC